ncbi:hypothetical protein ACFQV2_03715 [Actinokineospora soli]|uniref:Uncharacterized protein n=1 Tax=Actinokineospora soli TaxID=1048753 RepID=A0ABW2TJ59_9PSEU
MNGLVRCPICADEYRWPDEPEIAVFNEETQDYDFVNVAAMPPDKRADLARGGYRLCPNPSQDTPPHFLPATFADYGPPIVIGLVGAAHSGKTHLLTAMIRQAYLNGLSPYGVTVTALDFRRHENFRKQFVETFERGGELAGTDVGVIEAADILLLRGPGGERPVAFFDVAGEDLESTNARNRATRFLVGATAVIFVHASEDAIDTGRSVAASENQSFQLAVARLRDRGLPAAIAVAKSDRLRFVPPPTAGCTAATNRPSTPTASAPRAATSTPTCTTPARAPPCTRTRRSPGARCTSCRPAAATPSGTRPPTARSAAASRTGSARSACSNPWSPSWR